MDTRKTLDLHKKWQQNEEGGKRANLREADLQGLNLQGANLRRANLQGADLREADLRRANLREANLQGLNLQGADLRRTNLQGADLQGADLQGADLREADLREADLRRANLQGADLQGADLQEADFKGAKLPHFSVCPEEGGLVGWKKLQGNIIKLSIPAVAKRTSSLIGQKCRAEFAYVLTGSGTGRNGLKYKPGGLVIPDSYNDDIRIECSNGIHFFMTRGEAEDW